MALSFGTTTGSIFVRLGAIGGAYRAVIGSMGSGTPSPSTATYSSSATVKEVTTAYTAIDAQFLSAQQYVRDGLWAMRDQARDARAPELANLANFAASNVVEQVNANTTSGYPLIDYSLTGAVQELFTQMAAATASLKSNTTSVAVASVSVNTGNPVVISSLVGPTGVTRERVFPELMQLVVTDSNQFTATAGSEPMAISGQPTVAVTAYNWPQGSGASQSVTMTDATLDNNRNLLRNSSDWTFTGTTATYWSSPVGTWGSTVGTGSAGQGYRGGTTVPLKITGNGSELTAVVQTFNDSTNGTPGRLYPNTVYGFNAHISVSATPTSGVFAFSLVDGSNAIITNDAGTSQTLSQSLTGLTTTYVSKAGFFQTPKVLPSTIKLKAHLTTALDNTKYALVDNMALVEATESYTEGPYVAAFRGSTEVALNDTWNLTVSNNVGGVFQTLLWRWFDVGVKQLPSAGSPTIPDSLVS